LTPNWSRTAFSGQIPSEKVFGMPNVRKSWDIPTKTTKKKCRSGQLGNLRTYHHPPRSAPAEMEAFEHLIGPAYILWCRKMISLKVDTV